MRSVFMTAEQQLFLYALEQRDDIVVRCNEPMAPYTSFRIGGPADFYVEPQNREALREVHRLAKKYNIKTQVIGRGSNLLLADAGFRGAIVSTASMKQVHVNGTVITAEAGVSLTALAKIACEASLSGLAFSHGIPGSVGGAVFMNAGAYGGEISKVLTESSYYDTETDTFGVLSGEAHAFGYRHSVYKEHPSWVIVSATFRLSVGTSSVIRDEMDELMRQRIQKQPLEYPSAGSAFKRHPGYYTAQIIDEAGLKGVSVGGAQISEKHAGFIINRGDATASDVLALIQIIQEKIYRLHGIEIEPEIIYLPE